MVKWNTIIIFFLTIFPLSYKHGAELDLDRRQLIIKVFYWYCWRKYLLVLRYYCFMLILKELDFYGGENESVNIVLCYLTLLIIWLLKKASYAYTGCRMEAHFPKLIRTNKGVFREGFWGSRPLPFLGIFCNLLGFFKKKI